jgi:DNA-binding transcriptional ArsR family regulator
MAVAKIFKALGDQTRLEMVKRLSGGNSYSISKVTSELGISRQGARKHLQVLVDAKLIVLEPKGRDIIVKVDPKSLETAKEFIARLELQWDVRLNDLRNFVEKAEK